jgi:hypothetical protein
MRRAGLWLLLALAGCVAADRVPPGAAGVSRDTRGEPIMTAPGDAPVKAESCAHRRRCP